MTQQRLYSRSKYNAKSKLAYVTNVTDGEGIVAVARHSFVDLDVELPEAQRYQCHSDAEIVFGESPKGSVGAYIL